MLGGCAVAILIGVFTKSWMSGRGGVGGVGPLGVEVCFPMCRSIGWESAPGDIQLIAYLALFAGIAAAGASAWIAFLVFSNTPNKFPAFKLINGVFGIAAFATTFFAIRLLIESSELSLSWSPIFAIGGVVTGGIFIRKLRPYWPGQGNTPWPAIAKPAGPFGGQFGGAPPPGVGYPPMGPPPSGPPMGASSPQPPHGVPYGAPSSGPPMGASPQPPHGVPYGAPSSGPPMGAPPMGPGGPPMMGAPSSQSPWAAPSPPSGPPMGAAPMGPPAPSGPPMGAQPFGASPSPYGAPSPPSPYGAPSPPSGPPMGAPPLGAAASAPSGMPKGGSPMGAPMNAPPASAAPAGAPQNKATILGAPAPQLAAILKQQAAGASPQGASPQAAGASQFCGRCGKPMTFVAQYQRWFCEQCQQYA